MRIVIGGSVLDVDAQAGLDLIALGAATRYVEPMESKHTKPYAPPKMKTTQASTGGRSRKAGRTGTQPVAVTDKTNV